jgi:hypothetical protein
MTKASTWLVTIDESFWRKCYPEVKTNTRYQNSALNKAVFAEINEQLCNDVDPKDILIEGKRWPEIKFTKLTDANY